MEVEDRGIWFEDRKVGMESWWWVDLRICQRMGIKKSGGLLRVPPLLYVAATYSPTCAVPSA